MPKVFKISVERGEDRLKEAVFGFEILPDAKPDKLNEALGFRREIQTTNRTIRDVLNNIIRLDLYDSYVDQIIYIASLAFSSDLPDFAAAKVLLNQTREDFVMRVGQNLRGRQRQNRFHQGDHLHRFSSRARHALVLRTTRFICQASTDHKTGRSV